MIISTKGTSWIFLVFVVSSLSKILIEQHI